MSREASGETFQRVMTLYCLYRVCGEATDEQLENAGTSADEIVELMGRLEQVAFPPCFRPDIRQTIKNAELLIAVAEPEGSA